MNQSIQTIIDKIADAFSILDFSYIISGSVAYTLLYWILNVCTPDFYNTVSQQPTALVIIASCVITYSLGLFVSSGGAWIRERCRCNNTFILRHVYFDVVKEWKELWNVIEGLPIYAQNSQTCSVYSFDSYKGADSKQKIAKMYSFMWNSLASNSKSAARMNYINKFWVMQKVYEGLFLDALIAIFTVFIMTKNNDIMAFWPCMLVCVLLFLSALVFANEANKCAKTQLHEVVCAYKLYFSESVPKDYTQPPSGK